MSDESKIVQIIIIDDDPEQAHLLERALRREDQQAMHAGIPRIVKCYTDPAEAVADLPTEGPAVILCDYNLAESTGLDWLPHLVRAGLGPVMLMTAQGDERVASEAFKAGASDYLVKMDIFQTPSLLTQAIRDAMLHDKLERCNRELSRKLKNANHALQQKNDRLHDLTDTAHRFVEDVSHEFRTPLTAIKEFASIIRDGLGGAVTDKQVEFLGHIESSAMNLAQMVDDFLDTSKLRAQLLRVDRKPNHAADIYQSVRPILTQRAKAKGLSLIEQFDADLPETFCDREKAGRVLINLVINAIKFSADNSEIVVWARSSGDGDIRLGVTDQGPGLSEEDQAMMGGRHKQTHTGRSSRVKGFGLGLNIAKDLIRVNLGQMDVQSKLGEGSSFSFTLPCNQTEHILDRYLKVVTQTDPDVRLTVLHITPRGNPVFDAELVRQSLVSHSHSFDLVMQADDAHSLVLIGPTSEPEQWVQALKKHFEASRSGMQIDRAVFDMDVRWVGTWSDAKLIDAVSACASDLITGIKHCA